MTLWLVRSGRRGERESLALSKNLSIIGWEDVPDLSSIKTREELSALLFSIYPDEKPKTVKNWEGQIWTFIHEMKHGDMVAMPLKSRSFIAIGEVTGDYQFRKDLPLDSVHTRQVKWVGEYPRSSFEQDLLFSLGAFMTVCKIQRNNAEDRVKAIVTGKLAKHILTSQAHPDKANDELETPADLEQFARDQIREYISRKFKGHELANLVSEILIAQGYQVRVSPEGADGGVDILAGLGPLGFDAPRLAVQVKSGDGPVDIKVLHELQGVMKNFGAAQGLLVAWGGWKSSVEKEAARHFFEVRLWDSENLVSMIQLHYEHLSEDIQAELPLKRIWALVQSEV